MNIEGVVVLACCNTEIKWELKSFYRWDLIDVSNGVMCDSNKWYNKFFIAIFQIYLIFYQADKKNDQIWIFFSFKIYEII